MVVQQAKEVLRIEAEGILGLIDRIGENFTQAVDMIYEARGRVVIAGIGKSGLVGRKIVATLNSTGTPAIFLHPVEAMHGDLGMLMAGDVVLAMSNSGETAELNAILPPVKNLGARIIAMTGAPGSTLAGFADVVLDVGVAREACPMGLAPTASTTAALAMGDALAVALINRRQFSPKDFKRLHPGGTLGERLSVQVTQVMATGGQVPLTTAGTTAIEAIRIMDLGNLGVLLIVDGQNRLEGIFTDGDLRRLVMTDGYVPETAVGEIMTRKPITITGNLLASEALEIMQAHEVTVLPIVDGECKLLGILHLHKLLGKGKFSFDRSRAGQDEPSI